MVDLGSTVQQVDSSATRQLSDATQDHMYLDFVHANCREPIGHVSSRPCLLLHNFAFAYKLNPK